MNILDDHAEAEKRATRRVPKPKHEAAGTAFISLFVTGAILAVFGCVSGIPPESISTPRVVTTLIVAASVYAYLWFGWRRYYAAFGEKYAKIVAARPPETA